MSRKSEEREKKPRNCGITMIIDKGLGMNQISDLVDVSGQFVDYAKIAFASARILYWHTLTEKIGFYKRNNISVFLGGTTFESFFQEDGSKEKFVELVGNLGLKHMEISDGKIKLPEIRKFEIIKTLSRKFTVFSEVGRKDNSASLWDKKHWIEKIKRDLEAGAEKVILEARESGTTGIYEESGAPKGFLIRNITKEIDPGRLIFEAPLNRQQIFLINEFGPNVNLGNIKPEDAVALETARQGYRADTLET